MKERGRFFRYILLIFILAVMLVLASGCRQYKRVTRELETVTMGIDVGRENNRALDTAQAQSGHLRLRETMR